MRMPVANRWTSMFGWFRSNEETLSNKSSKCSVNFCQCVRGSPKTPRLWLPTGNSVVEDKFTGPAREIISERLSSSGKNKYIFSELMGVTRNNAYIWKISSGQELMCTSIVEKHKKIKNERHLNCTTLFATAGESTSHETCKLDVSRTSRRLLLIVWMFECSFGV